MKKKLIAIVRSLVLLVILILALVSTPFEVFGSGDSMVAVRGIRKLVQAAWIAIGWIAIETGIAWFQALRKPKREEISPDKASAKAKVEDPPAPISSAK